MKHRTLPVKRTPASQGIFKRLSAVTRNRRQRAATAAASEDFENEDHSSRISRALTIIFLIHIVVIGLIFVHQKFLDGGSSPETVAKKKEAAPAAAERVLPKLSDGGAIYRPEPGDNYDRIAAKMGIPVEDLRAANDNIDIQAGRVLRIPPRRIVAVNPPEVEAIRGSGTPDRDLGLVEAVPVEGAPRAVIVRPATTPAQAASAAAAPVASPRAPAASGRKHVVQQGDNIWRIANRYKVDQNTLMRVNGIKDPTKLRLGVTLTIP